MPSAVADPAAGEEGDDGVGCGIDASEGEGEVVHDGGCLAVSDDAVHGGLGDGGGPLEGVGAGLQTQNTSICELFWCGLAQRTDIR